LKAVRLEQFDLERDPAALGSDCEQDPLNAIARRTLPPSESMEESADQDEDVRAETAELNTAA
jgi:hypothetical protein